MNKPVRVLHYIPGFNFGGIESRFMDVYQTINHDDFQFDVMVLTSADNTLLKTFQNSGGNVYVMPPLNIKTIFNHIKAIRKFFESNHYDIVHCYSPIGYFVLKYAKRNGVQVRILHARTSSFGTSSFIWMRNILKVLTHKTANIYLSVSKPASKWLFKDSDEVEIIKNSVDASKFQLNLKMRYEKRNQINVTDQFLVGNVGRYSYQKNHLFTLKVFKEILELHPNSKLLLVGCELRDVEVEAKELNVIDKIIAVGYQNDVNPYYQAMDALLFPSFYEGLPGTLIEAQVSGLKCFVSSTITKEVNVTPEISFLDLDMSAKEWAEKIIEDAIDYRRIDQTSNIEKAGFELKASVSRLEHIYKSALRIK